MRLTFLDKLGAVGAFLAAGSCPACFPLLAVAGSALGLGVLRPFEGIALYIMQAFVVISLIGNIMSYRIHRKKAPLAIGIIAPALIFYAFYVRFSEGLFYSGLAGLFIAALLNFLAKKSCRACSGGETSKA